VNPRTIVTEHVASLIWDARRAQKKGAAVIAQCQRARLADAVARARTNSPYYRELYRELPERVDDPELLPVIDKKKLMARFDDWCVDREITLERAQAFADDPNLIGERFLNKYTLLTTSGTTGTRGVFVLDDRNMAVTNAMAFRALTAWLNVRDFVRILFGRGRMAMVMATGGHFASAVAAARLEKSQGRRLEVLSVRMPVPELVLRLNRFRPVLLAPYASMAALLASEQEAGRLHIDPVLLALSAEGLPQDEYSRIARAFKAKVGNSYAATECLFFSYSCEHNWLHVNSDWVVFEPVDAVYRPVRPGGPSHTVLISNLANRVQPILRYDLGDSILQQPGACPCGNPLPAIRVQGRSAEVLTFVADKSDRVNIAPLAFSTLADRTPGLQMFQIVQTAPMSLRVRLQTHHADSDRVWDTVQTGIERLLAEHGLNHVVLERADEPPERSKGGKFRQVIPLSDRARP
jgi:phenylacetate-coenzyme A ligase PaaK-like adenylate-forming protein